MQEFWFLKSIYCLQIVCNTPAFQCLARSTVCRGICLCYQVLRLIKLAEEFLSNVLRLLHVSGYSRYQVRKYSFLQHFYRLKCIKQLKDRPYLNCLLKQLLPLSLHPHSSTPLGRIKHRKMKFQNGEIIKKNPLLF